MQPVSKLLICTSVKVCDDVGVHGKLLQPPHKAEQLVSIFYHNAHVCCSGEFLCDVHSKKPEAANPFDLIFADKDKPVCVP